MNDPTPTKLRTLIVDDSAIVRQRLITLLSDIDRVELIGEVTDAPQALETIRALKPNVIILDIRMPGGSGLDVLHNIKQDFPTSTVIMLTNYPYPQYRDKCLAEGADFFLDKSTEFLQIAEAIDSVVL